MSAILVADCVGKSYGHRRVLSSGSLRAVPGEVRALLGRNGAGKSTLLKIAAGWISPDSGTVRWEERVELRASLPRLARHGLFYLPDHELLSPSFTLRAQLELLRRRFDGGDPVAAAERMGVAQVLDRKPGSFSGGETRRAELAAALVRRPRCLLADEPLRGIAPRDAELLLATLRDLARDGCAVVLTGHEVRTILPAADHVTWCIAGTTHELGPPTLALRDDAFRREYLGEGVAGVSSRP